MNPIEWNPWPEGKGKDGLFLPGFAGPSLVESMDVLAAIRDAIPPNGGFLELGTWCGVTAAWIAQQRPDVQVIVVDAFYGPPGTAEQRSQLALINLLRLPNVSTWCGTVAVFASLCQPSSFSAILVDADHSEAGCYADLQMSHFLLNTSGVIMAHDYGNPYHAGVTAAVDRFLASHHYAFTDRVASLAILKRVPT